MKELFHVQDLTFAQRNKSGPHQNLINTDNIWGDCTNIRGDASGITGDVSGLRAHVTNIWGNVCNLTGSVSGLGGDVTGLSGNADGVGLYTPSPYMYIGDVTGQPNATTVEVN
jgi:hypothetical protein